MVGQACKGMDAWQKTVADYIRNNPCPCYQERAPVPSHGSLIVTFHDCIFCRDTEAWAPDYLCTSGNLNTYQSCMRNRYEGKCPKGFAP